MSAQLFDIGFRVFTAHGRLLCFLRTDCSLICEVALLTHKFSSASSDIIARHVRREVDYARIFPGSTAKDREDLQRWQAERDQAIMEQWDIAASGYTVDRATVRQKKTGRPVRFELSEQTRQAVDDYIKAARKRPGEFLFSGHRGPDRSMTTRQYARLVSEWIGSIGLDRRLFGTHSLRRTKATLIYRQTGNLRAVQLLLGHTKIESTVRYLGIEVDDALAIVEQVDV